MKKQLKNIRKLLFFSIQYVRNTLNLKETVRLFYYTSINKNNNLQFDTINIKNNRYREYKKIKLQRIFNYEIYNYYMSTTLFNSAPLKTIYTKNFLNKFFEQIDIFYFKKNSKINDISDIKIGLQQFSNKFTFSKSKIKEKNINYSKNFFNYKLNIGSIIKNKIKDSVYNNKLDKLLYNYNTNKKKIISFIYPIFTVLKTIENNNILKSKINPNIYYKLGLKIRITSKHKPIALFKNLKGICITPIKILYQIVSNFRILFIDNNLITINSFKYDKANKIYTNIINYIQPQWYTEIAAYLLNTTQINNIIYLEDFVSSTNQIYIQLFRKKISIYNNIFFGFKKDAAKLPSWVDFIQRPDFNIHYTTYEFPLLSKTYRLFTIQTIGFLSKYYLTVYKSIESTSISKYNNNSMSYINNKFNYVIGNKSYNKNYNFYYLLNLKQHNLNNIPLRNNNFYLPIDNIIINKGNKLIKEKLLENIKLGKDKKMSKIITNNIKNGISSLELFKKLNKTNLLSKKICLNIFSYKYEKTLPQKKIEFNFINKYYNYNTKLFAERKRFANEIIANIKSLDINNSIFYLNNLTNVDCFNNIIKVIFQIISTNLTFLLPIIVITTIRNPNVIYNIKKVENILLLYIYLVRNFKYNLDKATQTNSHLFYFHILLHFVKEIHKYSYSNLCTNYYNKYINLNMNTYLYKLIKQHSTINTVSYRNVIDNYNYVIGSHSILNKKYYNKINKLKFKKKIDSNLKIEYIKYINYEKITNTLYISSKYFNTNLNSIAIQLFYNTSIEINNNYHINSKLNILNFKRFLSFNSKEYHLNRWHSFENLVLDLISNYKAIHKNSSIKDVNAGKIPIYSEIIMTKYFSEATNPYPKNILKTTVNNNILQKLFFQLVRVIPVKLGNNDYNFLEIDRLRHFYLESTQLFGFTKHRIMEPFESKLALRERNLPNKMRQSNIDVFTRNYNLWDIPINRFKLFTQSKSSYEPSYFNNEIYYLDFIDYIFFKYYILNSHIVNDPFAKIKKGLKNTTKKIGLDSSVHRTEIFAKIMRRLEKTMEKRLLQSKKGYVETEEEKLERYKQYEKSWITRFIKKVKRNFFNKKFWGLVKGKIRMEKAREREEDRRRKKKKKRIPIRPYKFAWDINMYSARHKMNTINKHYSWNPNNLKQNISKIKTSLYIINNLANYEINPMPFQIAALHLITSLGSKKINQSKIRKINKLLQSFTSTKIKLLKKQSKKIKQFKKIFSLFKPKLRKIKKKFYLFKHQRPIKRKERLNLNTQRNNITTFLMQKIKTVNRLGLPDLHIIPQYLKNTLSKEIHLYRKMIALVSQKNTNYTMEKVEHHRYLQTIINFNKITQIIDNLNSTEIKNDLLKLELLKKNIIYYTQIIVPYHAFYKDISVKLLHSATDPEYEWNVKQQKYKKRDSYLESKLVTLLKDENRHLEMQNKDYFFRHNIKKNKLFYNMLDPADGLPYIEYKSDYLINLINESNKQLIEYMYVNNKEYYNNRWIDIDTVFKIYKLIFKLKNKIEHNIIKYQKITKNINSKLMSMKILSKTYNGVRYNIINNLNTLMNDYIILKVPLAIMLTFIAQFTNIKKYSQFANNNLFFNIHTNMYFKKLDMYLNKYLQMNATDINTTILQLYALAEQRVPTNKSEQLNLDIMRQKANIQTKRDKFIDCTLERRFIWYLFKLVAIQSDRHYISMNTYNKIFSALNVRNKFINNKLQLYNIDKIANEFITTNKYILNLVEVPYYYYAMYKNKRYIYTQLEPVMVPRNVEEEAGLLKLSYYKAVPFVLNKSKNTYQIFLYYDRKQLTPWENKGQYITYPITLSNNKKEKAFFIRYKIYDIDVQQGTDDYIPQEYYKHVNYSYLTNKLGKISNLLYKNFFTHTLYSKYKVEELKAIYYNLSAKTKIGILRYSIDLSKEHNKLAQITKLSGLPNKELPMFKYIYNNIIDETGNYYVTDEKSGFLEVSPYLKSNIEKNIHYFVFPRYPDIENLMLFRFLRKLTIKESKYININYKVVLEANKAPLLFYSVINQPIMILLVYYSLGFFDTDSLSILKYNILKLPITNVGSIASIISLPTYLRNDDDTETDAENVDTSGIFYLRSKYKEIDQDKMAWPRHLDVHDHNLIGNSFILEIEPLHLLGIELNISPFFRLFTYSGWKIWKETINLLLIFQNSKFWNVGYLADIKVFNKIFVTKSFLSKPSTNIIELRKQFKLYDIHADTVAPYLNKYHQMSNYHLFKEWLGYYYYGLFEYQRIMPDSYHQLFSQPLIRSFIQYYFINSKELELISKRSLSNLLGSIYSMQNNPIGYEEFFVYPNKRIHQYRMYTPAILKNTTSLENYSMLSSNYKLPRTGYESYIYSYAANIWYTHHNLVTSNPVWHELFAKFNYLGMDRPKSDSEMYFDEGIKILNKILKSIKQSIRHQLFKTKRKKDRPMASAQEARRSKSELDPDNYIQNTDIIDTKKWAYAYGKEYGLFDMLKSFFITNTIKYSDINLLYKINNIYKPALNNYPYIALHPSIRSKYSVQFNYNGNTNINYSYITMPKLITHKMVLLNAMYPNNTYSDKFNFFTKINPLGQLTNTHLNLKNIVTAYKWRFSSLITANANYHESAFGPLWSIYHKDSAPMNKAINNSFLGLTLPTLYLGLDSFKNEMEVDYVEKTAHTANINERMYLRTPTTLPASVGAYPESGTFSTIEFDDVIAMFQYPHDDLSSHFFHAKNITRKLSNLRSRSYTNIMQKVLHSMYFPVNTIPSREYTSYIPVGYNLITKDLLNSNYAKLHYWHNPIYHRLNVSNYGVSQIASLSMKLLVNPNIKVEIDKAPNDIADISFLRDIDDDLFLDILSDKETKLDEMHYEDIFTGLPIPIANSIENNKPNLKNSEKQLRKILELQDSNRITIWYTKYKAFKLWPAIKTKFSRDNVPKISISEKFSVNGVNKINTIRNAGEVHKHLGYPFDRRPLIYYQLEHTLKTFGKMYSGLANTFFKVNNITTNIISQQLITPVKNNIYKYITAPIGYKFNNAVYNTNNYVINSINNTTNSISNQIITLIDATNQQLIKYDRYNNKHIYDKGTKKGNLTTNKIDIMFSEGLIKKVSKETANSNAATIKINQLYGFKRYPDLYDPMFQSYSPDKQPHTLSKILNHAITYTNRYHFINIYESFRMKPFYYFKTKSMLPYTEYNTILLYHINKVINKVMNTTKTHLNNLLHPLESQYSTDRSTHKLGMLEPNILYSIYQERKSEFPERIEKLYERMYWPYRYLRFPSGIVIFPKTPSTEELLIGIKPKKHLLYKIMNIFRFNWYNKIIQSTYYKPTKSYYPMVTMSRMADYMNLSKPLNKNNQYNKDIYKYLVEHPDVKDSLDWTNEHRARKRKEFEHRVEIQERVYNRYKKLLQFNAKQHRKELHQEIIRNAAPSSMRKIYRNKFQPSPFVKGKRILTREHSRWVYDILNPENEPPINHEEGTEIGVLEQIKLKNPHFKEEMRRQEQQLAINTLLDRQQPRKHINLTAFKDFTYRYSIPEMDEDLFTTTIYPMTIHKNNKIYQDLNIAQKLMQILAINNYQILDNNLSIGIRDTAAKKFEAKYIKILKKTLSRTLKEYGLTNYFNNKSAFEAVEKDKPLDIAIISNELMDEADNILDSIGRISYSDKLEEFTSKLTDFLESSSLSLFNNISSHISQYFIHEISELIIPRLKPVKFSTDKSDIKDSIFELLYDKSNNRYLNNNYNQMREPLALTHHNTLHEVINPVHIDQNEEDYFISDSSFTHEDEMANYFEITGKGLRPNEHKVFHIAYWKYLSTKYPKYQNNKYNTDEFITFKSNPHTMIDTASEFANETQNFILVRGSFKSKQFIYNYKINQKKHSLPLIEYFYYSQFGIDKSQLLKLNQFYILDKNLFSVFNDDYTSIYPYISKEKKKQYNSSTVGINQNGNKINKIINENIDLHNIIEFINYNIYIAVKPKTIESIYLYHNTLIRPIAHWFVQIYYNNIYYFDAFYSWCCDLMSNLIIF